MSARKQINRYKTEPSGADFDDVAKRAKAFFKDGEFCIWKYREIWNTSRPAIGFANPQGAVVYIKTNGRWEEA